MPFSFEDSWLCCDGASSCPCPNHLGSDWHLPLVFPDAIDDHPSLRHVASGNECPTSEEEDVINRSIPILQSQIHKTEDASQKLMRLRNALRLELEKVEGELGRLDVHHGQLSRALDHRSRIKAPIRRLPSEILSDILGITILLPFPYGHTEMDTDDQDVELEAFELVCKRWRRVVRQSPTLWSQIYIDPRATNFRNANSRGAWSLIRRINRSAHAELDVKIHSVLADRDEQPLPPLVMTLLEQICSRIRSLSLTLPPSKMVSLYPLRDSFKSLRYLFVSADATNLPPIKLFDKATKLVVFDTTGRAIGTRIGIPWCQIIRHSAWRYASIHTALEGLEAANNLQDGTFSMNSGSKLPLRVGLDPIVCAHLTSLTVNISETAIFGQNAHPLRQLFEQCSFPTLDQLYVSTCGVTVPTDAPDTVDTFHALLLCLQRSCSPLSVLSYDHGPVSFADVDAFFRTTPTIVHVKFTRISSGLSDAAFQSLHVQPGQGVNICAPWLESVLFEGEFEFDAANFASMVKSRWDIAPLYSIDLHWHVVTDERDWGDVDPEVEVKTRRWTLEAAVLADGLKGYAERGMYLGICTRGCDVLAEFQMQYI